MTESTVYVTAKTDGRGRDAVQGIAWCATCIGWKVSNVELYFPSQN